MFSEPDEWTLEKVFALVSTIPVFFSKETLQKFSVMFATESSAGVYYCFQVKWLFPGNKCPMTQSFSSPSSPPSLSPFSICMIPWLLPAIREREREKRRRIFWEHHSLQLTHPLLNSWQLHSAKEREREIINTRVNSFILSLFSQSSFSMIPFILVH